MAGEDASERKTYSVRLPTRTFDRLKHLAVDEHRTLSAVLEEAAEDLLVKYGKAGHGGDQDGKGGKRGRRKGEKKAEVK